MLGTMQDGQLSIANLLRHGSRVHANAEVVTWTGEGARRATFAEVAREAARLAHALRGLGVTSDQRVGTFMWNNNEHLVAYLAVPAMGAVLHTLNIRLFPEQLTYVANHAEDHVVLVDATLVPLLAKVLPTFDTVKHVVVVNGDAGALTAPEGVTVHSYADLLAGQPDEFDWPAVDENSAAAMCYTSGTTGDPKGVVYTHRSIWLHSMQVCMTQAFGLTTHSEGAKKSDLNALTSRVNSLQGAVSKNSKDTQNALNASIAQLQQSISGLQKQQAQASATISTLQSQIAAGALNQKNATPGLTPTTPGSTPGATTTTTPNNAKSP